MEKGLVSLITPCYNTGKVIHRLLDSVLSQDYPNIEMFVVDDGSTDNSKDIILSYVPRFENKNYKLYYFYQDNAGQSVAVNRVLGEIKGEFLAWPDSDDYYSKSNSISSFVKAFCCIDDSYGLVRCYPIKIDEVSLHPIEEKKNKSYVEEQFENCLYSSSDFVWPPISYMARVTCFKQANPDMRIYSAYHTPQNWQMLLPLLFSFKCHTLQEPLSCVLVRSDSYSRGTYKTYDQLIQYYENFENIIINTLESIYVMKQDVREQYVKTIRKKYLREKYFLSIYYHQPQKEKEYLGMLKNMGYKRGIKEKINVFLLHNPIISKILRAIKKIVK